MEHLGPTANGGTLKLLAHKEWGNCLQEMAAKAAECIVDTSEAGWSRETCRRKSRAR